MHLLPQRERERKRDIKITLKYDLSIIHLYNVARQGIVFPDIKMIFKLLNLQLQTAEQKTLRLEQTIRSEEEIKILSTDFFYCMLKKIEQFMLGHITESTLTEVRQQSSTVLKLLPGVSLLSFIFYNKQMSEWDLLGDVVISYWGRFNENLEYKWPFDIKLQEFIDKKTFRVIFDRLGSYYITLVIF